MDTMQSEFPIECTECLFKAACSQTIVKDEFNMLFRSTVMMNYRKNETILKQGLKSGYLVYLHKGIVKFTSENQSNRNLILAITKAPSLLGLANILNDDINLFSIVAIEDCRGCLIDLNKLKFLALKNPNFLLTLLKMSSDMFRTSILNFISLAHKQVNGRLADILLYLSENIYQSRSFQLTLSRAELAEFAGCSKENIINTLRKFNAEGIVEVKGKHLEILDIDTLIRISRKG